jgi:hypothetical protein
MAGATQEMPSPHGAPSVAGARHVPIDAGTLLSMQVPVAEQMTAAVELQV